jgi:dTDP-4-amino-4,6-dideoxygalactose transaminase
MPKKPIYVTEPFLPPLEEYVAYLKGIWERNQLTNQGPLVRELEQKLQAYHRISMPVHCVANGGLGLQIILKALGVRGEVITTPFSYVATTSCPLWEGCSVVFADIEPDYLTLDPAAVEAAITPHTEAVIATHVFGNPCDVDAFQRIGEKHGIPIIYDAAHAFGVTYKGRSILEYGDASMVSLHATKLFHTVEGGFVVAKDPVVAAKIEWMRRFGHKGAEEFHGVGINAKMSELHAAMGLCVLNHIDEILSKRKEICSVYDKSFGFDTTVSKVTSFSSICYREKTFRNFAYYPILFESEAALMSAMSCLEAKNVQPRRYFFPDLSKLAPGNFSIVEQMNESVRIAERILCLPIASNYSCSVILKISNSIFGI